MLAPKLILVISWHCLKGYSLAPVFHSGDGFLSGNFGMGLSAKTSRGGMRVEKNKSAGCKMSRGDGDYRGVMRSMQGKGRVGQHTQGKGALQGVWECLG